MSRALRMAKADTVAKPRRHLKIKIENDEKATKKANPPEGWEETYNLIAKMRKESAPAPVDIMGCASLHDPKGDPKVNRFQILVGLMLSAMTKDAVTSAAFNRLNSQLPGGLTVTSVAEASQSTMEDLIIPVGFFRRKAGYLIETAKILRDKYSGDIPTTLKEICALPGVGPKMGHLCMQVAWGKVEGIGVDVHMHRIFNRLGWCKTKTPEQTRMSMEEWLPKEYWDKINKLVVGFGQTRCSAIKPQCEGCLIRERCPFGRPSARERAKAEKTNDENAGTKPTRKRANKKEEVAGTHTNAKEEITVKEETTTTLKVELTTVKNEAETTTVKSEEETVTSVKIEERGKRTKRAPSAKKKTTRKGVKQEEEEEETEEAKKGEPTGKIEAEASLTKTSKRGGRKRKEEAAHDNKNSEANAMKQEEREDGHIKEEQEEETANVKVEAGDNKQTDKKPRKRRTMSSLKAQQQKQ